jgi:hypothetical protein
MFRSYIVDQLTNRSNKALRVREVSEAGSTLQNPPSLRRLSKGAPEASEAFERPVRVRFVGARGRYNSVATQAVRIHEGLCALNDPAVSSDLLLLPRGGLTSRFPGWRAIKTPWSRLAGGVDILVLVKPSLFWELEPNARSLRAWCDRRGVVLVSAPADGAAGESRDKPDVFSNEIADFVFTISRPQYDELVTHRDPATVFHVASATRPSLCAAIEVRDFVRTVVWENPPHHDPYFDPSRHEISRESYREVERTISELCEANGAVLLTVSSWRDDRSDAEWERMLLSADIAIECKSLERQYTPYQLNKPPVKLQNYLALGLPTVCDSLPSHLEVGRPAGVLFADTLDEWKQKLGRLFESKDLREDMSRRARQTVAPLSIESVCRHYVACFRQMQSLKRAAAMLGEVTHERA